MTIKKFAVFLMALALPFALMSCSDDPVSTNGNDNGNGNGDNGNGGETATLEFPITFEEDLPWDEIITNFSGGELSVVDNPDKSGINTSDKVAKMVKGDGEPWGGAVVLLPESINFDNGTDFTFSVWAPRADSKMLFKIENEEEAGQAFEREITVAESNEWVDITFSLAAANQSYTYEKLVFIFDLGTVGDGSANFTWYFDNIRQEEGDGGNGGDPATEPADSAPTPTDDPANVISLFSDEYTDVGVNTWRTDWSAAEYEEISINGNATKKYSNLNFVGIETTGDNLVDASEMNFFHIDVWTPNMDVIRVKLVDFGPDGEFEGGDDSEHEIIFDDLAKEQWHSLKIPLTEFTGLENQASIAQYILSGTPAGAGILYVDNFYFSTDGGNGGDPATEPADAAPTPTEDPADVISLFSDAYSDVTVNTWRTDWSAAAYEEISINGNATKKYSNLDFVGIETTGDNLVDASGMNFFHIDVWTPNMDVIRVKLVDFGPDGNFGGGDDSEHELIFDNLAQGQWHSLKIPMAEFTGLQNQASMAQYILSGLPTGAGTLYVDNFYFSTDGSGDGGTGDQTTPKNPIDFETDGFGADWTWTVFENDANPALEIIANPDQTGINASSTVAQFTALQTGNPWAGVESAHGTADLGPFVLDGTNSIIRIMVWKPVISDVGIKLVSANGWSEGELKVANTVVNEWEELVFDFSSYNNPPAAEGQLDQVVVFPDFDMDGRGQDNIIYFDNITFSAE